MAKRKLQTKDDFLTLFKEINEPLRKFSSPGKSRIRYAHNGVAFGNEIGEIEGFARLLWGAGPSIGQLEESWVSNLVTGLANGCNPQHAEFWGDLHDRDQRMVEMPAMALALLYQDQLIWKKLSKTDQQNLIKWFSQILKHECADGNWQFFKVIVATVIKKLGYEVDETAVASALEKIERCYLSDGWYQDSSRGRQDYYNPFAFHYYGLVYSKLCPTEQRSIVYRERALRFAEDYLHFFAEDGSNLPFGRSTTYRFAVISFWSALVWSGNTPFDLSVLKGLIVRNLEWWLTKDIFDGNQILSLGYTYAQLSVTEPYNSTLSPYWLNKVFLLLDLPENHDFWQVAAAPMPKRPETVLIKNMKAIFQHDGKHTVMLNAGEKGPNFHVLTNEKYLKFAYSSCFGYSVPRSNQLKAEQAMDSMLGIQRKDTMVNTSVQNVTQEIVGQFMVRNNVQDIWLSDSIVASTWKPTNNCAIRTWLIPWAGWQIRIHRAILDTDYVLYETAFALGHPVNEHGTAVEGVGNSSIQGKTGFSGILDLQTEAVREAAGTICWPNTNIMDWDTTYLPGLQGIYSAGTHYLATAIYAHPDGKKAVNKWAEPPKLVSLDTAEAIIRMEAEEKIFHLT